jgi:hypothetical protein
MKHLKYTSETLAKTLETIVNIRNIQIKQSHHMCENNATFLQHTSKKTDETLKTGACNIREQPLQQVKYPIYFCNIRMKNLQHTSETFETQTIATCVFHPSSV